MNEIYPRLKWTGFLGPVTVDWGVWQWPVGSSPTSLVPYLTKHCKIPFALSTVFYSFPSQPRTWLNPLYLALIVLIFIFKNCEKNFYVCLFYFKTIYWNWRCSFWSETGITIKEVSKFWASLSSACNKWDCRSPTAAFSFSLRHEVELYTGGREDTSPNLNNLNYYAGGFCSFI